MSFIDKIKQSETIKGLFLAHLIILLQILVVAFIGMTVVFIGGLARYLLWVLLGGGALFLVLAYVIYRRFRTSGRDLIKNLDVSTLQGRPFEIRFLGGLMSFKVGESDNLPALEHKVSRSVAQLEDTETIRKRELAELAQLLADDLISPEEFTSARQKIMRAD
jgi:vacuolar-type H+-ATPase subunit I/STV1